MKSDRKGFNSSLRPVSKKRQAEIKAGLRPKKPAPRKKASSIEEVPGFGKTVFRASSLGDKPKGERSQLVDQVDAAYSKMRKLQALEKSRYNERINCFICGIPVPLRLTELMHCEPRLSMGTRFDDINCQVGCHSCNSKPLGDRAEFRRMLDVAFGPGTAERNEINSKTVEKMGAEYLRHLLEKFNKEIKRLER